jgi:hypothetical protein
MELIKPPMHPGKGHWPKSKKKKAMRRYRINAAWEIRKP